MFGTWKICDGGEVWLEFIDVIVCVISGKGFVFLILVFYL